MSDNPFNRVIDTVKNAPALCWYFFAVGVVLGLIIG